MRDKSPVIVREPGKYDDDVGRDPMSLCTLESVINGTHPENLSTGKER